MKGHYRYMSCAPVPGRDTSPPQILHVFPRAVHPRALCTPGLGAVRVSPGCWWEAGATSVPAKRALGLSTGPGAGGQGQRLAVSPPVQGSTWLEKHQVFPTRALA